VSHDAPSSVHKYERTLFSSHFNFCPVSARHRLKPIASAKIRSAYTASELPRLCRDQREDFEHISTCVVAPLRTTMKKRSMPDARSTYTGRGGPAMNFRMNQCCAEPRPAGGKSGSAIRAIQLVESARRFTFEINQHRRSGNATMGGRRSGARLPFQVLASAFLLNVWKCGLFPARKAKVTPALQTLSDNTERND
jgi:hypothetical protein